MEQLIAQFQKLNINTNYVNIGHFDRLQLPHATNQYALEAHKRTVLHAMAQHLYTHEIEEILSMRRPDPNQIELVYSDFFAGDIPPHDIDKDEIYHQALDYVTTLFAPPQKCRPAHIFDVRYHYPHERSSNAEAPFSTEDHYRQQAPKHAQLVQGQPGTYSVGNMFNIIFDESRRFHHIIKNGAPFDDYLWYIQLHNRTAIVGPDDPDKIRSVSGFPRPQNIAWIMFLWPYLNFMKTRDPRSSPMLWNFETNLGGWLRLNYLLFTGFHRCTIITLDKHKFDKFYYFAIQDDIDRMIQSFIDFDNGYLPTKDYPDTQSAWTAHKGNRLRRLFKWLTYSFRSCPTLTPHGQLFRRKFAGMPSGVFPVQIFDTIYFAITDTDVLLRLGISLNQIRLRKGQGDDIITQLTVCIPPDQHQPFLDAYSAVDTQRFGSKVSTSKSEIRNSPHKAHVLGYRNNRSYPTRSTIDLLASLYHSKARLLNESTSMATAVGIAHASLYHDPRVYRICKNVYYYYAEKGFTMNQNFLRRSTAWTGLDLSDVTEFPTPDQICQKLFDFSFEPRKQTVDYFPRDHFLSTF
jgi:hypothetical protein